MTSKYLQFEIDRNWKVEITIKKTMNLILIYAICNIIILFLHTALLVFVYFVKWYPDCKNHAQTPKFAVEAALNVICESCSTQICHQHSSLDEGCAIELIC